MMGMSPTLVLSGKYLALTDVCLTLMGMSPTLVLSSESLALTDVCTRTLALINQMCGPALNVEALESSLSTADSMIQVPCCSLSIFRLPVRRQ
jgi:hypothetical protein